MELSSTEPDPQAVRRLLTELMDLDEVNRYLIEKITGSTSATTSATAPTYSAAACATSTSDQGRRYDLLHRGRGLLLDRTERLVRQTRRRAVRPESLPEQQRGVSGAEGMAEVHQVQRSWPSAFPGPDDGGGAVRGRRRTDIRFWCPCRWRAAGCRTRSTSRSTSVSKPCQVGLAYLLDDRLHRRGPGEADRVQGPAPGVGQEAVVRQRLADQRHRLHRREPEPLRSWICFQPRPSLGSSQRVSVPLVRSEYWCDQGRRVGIPSVSARLEVGRVTPAAADPG